jgi:hypothetical protein
MARSNTENFRDKVDNEIYKQSSKGLIKGKFRVEDYEVNWGIAEDSKIWWAATYRKEECATVKCIGEQIEGE